MIEKVLEKLGANRYSGWQWYLTRADSDSFNSQELTTHSQALLEKECQLYLREKGWTWFCLDCTYDNKPVLRIDKPINRSSQENYEGDTLLECYMKAVMGWGYAKPPAT
jgi:hypothetical protein